MVHLIKSSDGVSGRRDPAAVMSKKRLSPNVPPPAVAAADAAKLDPPANPDDSAQFRAGILQRYNAPFQCAGPYDSLSQ
jgi:hypothetical protein